MKPAEETADAGRLAAEAAASLSGSLLQYVAINRPWVDGDVVPSDDLDRLAARQRDDAALLTRFARDRHVPPDPPAFADVFAEYHYVGFAWLAPKIADDAAAKINALHTARETAAALSDAAASRAVFTRVIESEADILAELRVLVPDGASGR
ncbi:MAG: hypothetical protein AAF532_10110 [Planctomycetota bacterium]